MRTRSQSHCKYQNAFLSGHTEWVCTYSRELSLERESHDSYQSASWVGVPRQLRKLVEWGGPTSVMRVPLEWGSHGKFQNAFLSGHRVGVCILEWATSSFRMPS